jgi:hypothetical protein
MGERPRRTLEERFDLLLQRAPIEAGALLQTLDGLLIKAPHKDQAHPVLPRIPERPGITLIGARRWLPFGCHSGRIL